jgi:FkbM family methyltransferase
MEGNECYKFSVIRHYIERTGVARIRVAIDIGANVGDATQWIRDYFPTTTIYAVEVVPEYYNRLRERFSTDANVFPIHAAVTYQHRYRDDIAAEPRNREDPLVLLRGLAAAGGGYVGGSIVADSATSGYNSLHYAPEPIAAPKLTLKELVARVLEEQAASDIDFIKFDCEGCEHSCLGCTEDRVLCRIRFISGEYHDVARFYDVMRARLFRTHRVNLVGDARFGSFFAERMDIKPPILRDREANMLHERPWLVPGTPIDWCRFRDDFVPTADRRSCGL